MNPATARYVFLSQSVLIVKGQRDENEIKGGAGEKAHRKTRLATERWA